MKRKIWVLPMLALVSACSKTEDQAASSDASQSAPAAQESAAGDAVAGGEHSPAIDITIAPGVAFDFSYSFALPERQIAATQESHGALCGSLGITQCRVTGLSFNKARDGEIEASMAFAINPALALRFAKDATDLVERVDGTLDSSSVTGKDVGTGIVADDKDSAGMNAELAKIDAQLKIPNLSKTVRSDLVAKAASLRDQLAAIGKDRDAKVDSLATTPMRFTYAASETVLGLDRSSPIEQGLSAGAGSLSALLAFVAMLLGYAGPWLIAGAGIFWVVKRLRARVHPAVNPDHPA